MRRTILLLLLVLPLVYFHLSVRRAQATSCIFPPAEYYVSFRNGIYESGFVYSYTREVPYEMFVRKIFEFFDPDFYFETCGIGYRKVSNLEPFPQNLLDPNQFDQSEWFEFKTGVYSVIEPRGYGFDNTPPSLTTTQLSTDPYTLMVLRDQKIKDSKVSLRRAILEVFTPVLIHFILPLFMVLFLIALKVRFFRRLRSVFLILLFLLSLLNIILVSMIWRLGFVALGNLIGFGVSILGFLYLLRLVKAKHRK